MCGRVDIHTPPAQLARALEAQLAAGVDPEGKPSWNVGPTRGLPAIVETDDHERVLDVFRWGLVPHFFKDPKASKARMINARAETIATKPAYRAALLRRRCLIAVDGFYEWHSPDPSAKRKVPYYFTRADGAPITFAGLYEVWWDKSRSKAEPDPNTFLQTCVIVTTEAGPDMADIHDRMPVIIEEGDRARWLDPELQDADAVTSLLRPSPAGTLVKHAVAVEVNNVRNDGPQMIEPVTVEESQLLLPPGTKLG